MSAHLICDCYADEVRVAGEAEEVLVLQVCAVCARQLRPAAQICQAAGRRAPDERRCCCGESGA
jgi:hypothetical protein